MFYYMLGPGYIFVFIALIVSLISQSYVRSAYSKYSKIQTLEGLTGKQVAEYILKLKNINDVEVIMSKGGELSDHYDPTKKIVALSPKVYNDTSIASVSVAAHECGHAVQHAEGYAFISIRNKVLPFAIISGKFSMVPILIGLFGNQEIFMIGIIMLAVVALFQLVTLPVEFDASKRALNIIETENILNVSELEGSKKMLTAAALTYVAALLSTLLNILRYLAIFNSRRD